MDGSRKLANKSEEFPVKFDLQHNYPNLFNPSTVINYQLTQACQVKISIYDVLGRHVKTLVNHQQPVGYFRTTWNGTDESNLSVAAGVYFCRMQAGEFVKMGKLVLVR